MSEGIWNTEGHSGETPPLTQPHALVSGQGGTLRLRGAERQPLLQWRAPPGWAEAPRYQPPARRTGHLRKGTPQKCQGGSPAPASGPRSPTPAHRRPGQRARTLPTPAAAEPRAQPRGTQTLPLCPHGHWPVPRGWWSDGHATTLSPAQRPGTCREGTRREVRGPPGSARGFRHFDDKRPRPERDSTPTRPTDGQEPGNPAGEPRGVGPRGGTCRPQKKFLISGVTSFTHSFTCRLGCSKVAADTAPDLR